MPERAGRNDRPQLSGWHLNTVPAYLVKMALVYLLSLIAVAQCTVITFNNTAPRLDVNGNIVNGHDGPTIQFQKVVSLLLVAGCHS